MRLMKTIIVIVLIIFLNLQSIQTSDILEDDDNTLSNYNKVQVQEYDLDIKLDFQQKVITGEITIKLEALTDKLDQVHLDSWHLDINSVYLSTYEENQNIQKVENAEPTWVSSNEIDEFVGGALYVDVDGVVPILQKDGETYKIGALPQGTKFMLKIQYTTKQQAYGQETGFQFIDKKYSLDGEYNFFYTQNEPIYARTWFPCLDTPRIIAPFYLHVTCERDLKVWTSLLDTDPEIVVNDDGTITWDFQQSEPGVRSYQVAIVAGFLTEQKIGDSVYLYTPEKYANDAAQKMKNIEQWINFASDYLGYEINQEFNFILMPGNYPFKGKQQGKLTYISPSILFTEKSGESVIFHEIASFFFGNVVSTCNWRNVWLNEGIATYIERFIQDFYLVSSYSQVDRIVGNYTLQQSFDFIDNYGLPSTFKTLHPNTKLLNPDDTLTAVPYEKGYQFMEYLQTFVSNSQQIVAFLKVYLQNFANQSVDYYTFQQSFEDWLIQKYGEKDGEQIIEKIDFNLWIEKEGNPPYGTLETFTSASYNKAVTLANKFVQFNGAALPQDWEDVLRSSSWNSEMQYAFLNHFLQNTYVTSLRLIKQLDQKYHFKNNDDDEIQSRWFTLTSLHNYQTEENDYLLSRFVSVNGRISQILPIYEALNLNGRTIKAKQLLLSNYKFYHPQTIIAIENVVGKITEINQYDQNEFKTQKQYNEL
ncbi:Armadillo-type fold [Pseudocohnilembus persalinus]|uniref:Armadillo-type fold n=1 Tax=Pseudocohnilembus persalinus TaxID=266149 RepID=A0A0V0QJK6_PSEPJ|nr:Armadillo-type fold [Pseudocohnilembus persalinus]|eukprot:KRX02300.1 Armadillo-type fold [Pseudocohnilembus persalinus]